MGGGVDVGQRRLSRYCVITDVGVDRGVVWSRSLRKMTTMDLRRGGGGGGRERGREEREGREIERWRERERVNGYL